MERIPQPHDLLYASQGFFFETSAEEANAQLARASVVVVRRGPMREGGVPIGVRGPAREQRYAGWLAMERIEKVVRPEALRVSATTRKLPAFEALGLLEERWRGLGSAWGPAGSVGFELATGVDCVREESDLDLLIRAEEPMPIIFARELFAATRGLPAEVEVLIETPLGGVNLAEFARGGSRCLLRTAAGPRLVRCAWCAA